MRRIVYAFSFLVLFAGALFGQNPKIDKRLNEEVNGLKSGATKDSETVRVIVQTKGDTDGQGVSSHIVAHGGKVLDKFTTFSGAVAEVPAKALEGLAAQSAVSRMSLDGTVSGHATSDTST